MNERLANLKSKIKEHLHEGAAQANTTWLYELIEIIEEMEPQSHDLEALEGVLVEDQITAAVISGLLAHDSDQNPESFARSVYDYVAPIMHERRKAYVDQSGNLSLD